MCSNIEQEVDPNAKLCIFKVIMDNIIEQLI